MRARSEPGPAPQPSSGICAECEQMTVNMVPFRDGAGLCAECAAAYYLVCSGCEGLVPRDESIPRDGAAYCAACFSKPPGRANAGVVDETLIEALVTEYVALHAEEKRISERMETIKEQLKNAAERIEREGNAVTLGSGEAAVRCSYRISLKCDAGPVAALAEMLGEEEFSSLFERKTSFAPVKDRIAAFLAAEDPSRREAREAVRAAVRETETVTLSVLNRKPASQ